MAFAPNLAPGTTDEAHRRRARAAAAGFAVLAPVLPLIVVGVLASSLVLRANASLRPADTLLGVIAVSTVALLLTLPTFFELPIALVALAAGPRVSRP